MAKRTVGMVTASAGAGTGAAGAAAIVITWLVGLAGVEVPAEVGAALATLLATAGAIVGGYLVPGSRGGGDHAAE